MQTHEQQRLELAGRALSGLLACQNPDNGWQIDAVSVVSLTIADRVLHYASLPELPKLADARPPEPEPPMLVTQPEIILPRE
jgi:hypothetical protein